MILISERIAVLLFGSSFIVFIFYLVSRRPVIFVSFFFIIFTFAWRTLATMFIDLRGPVYSQQLVRDVGPGTATIIHTIAYFLILLPFLYFLRESAVARWNTCVQCCPASPGVLKLPDMTFAISVLFFSFLFFDLTRHGPIPFFGRIERYAYPGGLAHLWFSTYGNFLAFWYGLMFAAGYIRERKVDFRMISLLGVMIAYAFLTGNRFSAFYSQCSFFIIPCGAVIATRIHQPNRPHRSWTISDFVPRRFRFAAIGLAAMMIITVSFAIYNSLVNVRGYTGSEIWIQLRDRILIQPSEIGWTSFERIYQDRQFEPPVVFRFLFQDPIDAKRNTSIQYLMFETIGEPRTTDQAPHGFQLAGGFPEIFFELFGPYLAWPFLLGVACIAAALSACIIRGTLLGNYASAFLCLYVLFGFYVMYIGGMLNFVMPWTYWVKVVMLVVVLLAERALADRGLSLLPWNLLVISQRKT